ncbi:hypothetical protein EDC04DRAFT_2610917 [Pisolithus marmoratus]|nr:hypothetical protein EDC04DRAFT_2610917 [Pisolithus marmoratus]
MFSPVKKTPLPGGQLPWGISNQPTLYSPLLSYSDMNTIPYISKPPTFGEYSQCFRSTVAPMGSCTENYNNFGALAETIPPAPNLVVHEWKPPHPPLGHLKCHVEDGKLSLGKNPVVTRYVNFTWEYPNLTWKSEYHMAALEILQAWVGESPDFGNSQLVDTY